MAAPASDSPPLLPLLEEETFGRSPLLPWQPAAISPNSPPQLRSILQKGYAFLALRPLSLLSPPPGCYSSILYLPDASPRTCNPFTGRASQNTHLSSPTAFAPWLVVAIATERHSALDTGAPLLRWHLHLSVTKRNPPLPLLKSHCPLVFSSQEWCRPQPRGSGPNLGGALGSCSLAPYSLSIRSPVGSMAKYNSTLCSCLHLSAAVTVQEATTPACLDPGTCLLPRLSGSGFAPLRPPGSEETLSKTKRKSPATALLKTL